MPVSAPRSDLLRAPVAYEIVRGHLMRLSSFDAAAANRLLAAMRAEAEAIVRRGAPDAPLVEQRSAFMRYRGQGHEIAVELPVRDFAGADRAAITALFEDAYRRLYSRPIPGVEIEILSWVVSLGAPVEGALAVAAPTLPSPASGKGGDEPKPRARRPVFDPQKGEFEDVPIYWRADLKPGAHIAGPAVIAEDDTSTVVSAALRCPRSTGSVILNSSAARVDHGPPIPDSPTPRSRKSIARSCGTG